ncbi:DgyrCDS10521 [Dimorphilus gyrociliatus]|uniref:RRP15-like protein n=1 Tax=Dimorphilus gyrociliatus TaxID=2664684 RepID=A0A7I8W0G3_9ANNE|nr:DgyrCDS10521 [Dimorphilus gyrociliatus]
MSKILSKNIPDSKKSVILSKARTDKQIFKAKLKRRQDDTDDSDSDNEYQRKQKKLEWKKMARTKPKPLDKEKERTLAKIATRGVVQLFNAVRSQQKQTEERLMNASTEAKKDQVLKDTKRKGTFIDMLKNEKPNKEGAKKWKALKEDLSMESANMKDWSDENGEESDENDEITDEDDNSDDGDDNEELEDDE